MTDALLEPVTATRPDRRGLTFNRTVDRSLVHRRAVSEVFVTDLVEIDSKTRLIGAQLPKSHSFFLDTPRTAPRYDILLLTECARQGCTFLAHALYDVPADWMFLMTQVSTEIFDGPALDLGDRPAELEILARQDDAEVRNGRLRTLRASLELSIGGVRVGRMTGDGRYLTTEEYGFLRSGHRDGPTPLSTDLAHARGVPVQPGLVGRREPLNVLLVDARRTPEGAQAVLAVPAEHPTIFDHPLDHYPGMALLEAGSQAALLAAVLDEPGRGPGRVTSLRGRFAGFAELDVEVLVQARFADPANTKPDRDGRVPVRVAFSQAGSQIASIDLDLTWGGGARPGTAPVSW
jgi:2-oxo-3-(phosphooxy)propyl 3-oxoalkanoate synthase